MAVATINSYSATREALAEYGDQALAAFDKAVKKITAKLDYVSNRRASIVGDIEGTRLYSNDLLRGCDGFLDTVIDIRCQSSLGRKYTVKVLFGCNYGH